MAVIRTHTEYDFDQLVQLQRVVGERLNPRAVRSQRVSAVLGGLGFAGAGVLLAWKGEGVLSLVFCLLGLGFILSGVGYYYVAAYRAYRGQKGERGYDYIFEKKAIHASRGKAFATYAYTDCNDLLETENAFYLLLEGQGLVVDKSNVKGGTVEELGALLQERCGRSFTWMGKGKKA